MTKSIARDSGILALAVVLVTTAVQVESFRERKFPAPPFDADEAVLYFRSGTALRRLSNAFSALAADVYWIRTIQYFGGTRRRLAAAGLPRDPEPPQALSIDSPRNSSQGASRD